jgi:hypothetical protein
MVEGLHDIAVKCKFRVVEDGVLKTGPAGRTSQTVNQIRGDRSGSNVGSAMQLDWWEPLKTGEPPVSSNRRFDCTRFFFLFFFSAKSPKTTSFCIFF